MTDPLELTLLQIVAQGRGHYGWHDIGVQLSMVDVPRDRDMLATLRGLARRGLVQQSVDGNVDQWEITQAGHRALETELPPDLATLAATLRGDLRTRVAGLGPRLDNPGRLVEQLDRLRIHASGLEDGIAFAASVLPEPDRTTLLLDLSQADAVATRRALFRLWAPQRFVQPGRRPAHLDDPHWDGLIRRGLTDSDTEVRTMAAGLAFDTDRGAAVHPELVANTAQSDARLRQSSLLALGSARDSVSLRTLRRAVASVAPTDANAALRALAARPDGHSNFWAALDDRRQELRDAALFALRWVVKDLDETRCEELAQRPDEDLQHALQSYLARMKEKA